jgi:hypothetical protein
VKRLLLALAFALATLPALAQNVNRSGTLLVSAARTATVTGADISNDNYACLTVILDITAVPGVDTVTVAIQGKDPASGKYYALLTGAAVSATGTTTYSVCPGITAAANVSASAMVPRTWRVNVTHSAGTSFTYSLGYNINY